MIYPEPQFLFLVFLIPLIVQALRPLLDRYKVDSSLLPWVTLAVSCLAVIPLLIWQGAPVNWRLLAGAVGEGVPVGVLAIILYDLGGKPLKKAWKRWRQYGG